jgi:hypothetical protein
VRVGQALEASRPQFAACGLGLKLVESNAKLARVRVRWISTRPELIDRVALRKTLETAIIEAAPDLDMLEIEGLDATVAAMVG